MNSHKPTSKNLYTLNEDVLILIGRVATDLTFKVKHPISMDQLKLSSAINNFKEQKNNYKSQQQSQYRLNGKVQQLEKHIYKYKIQNKDLKDALDISEMKNTKHQEKQRELIKKLSHQQVSNKQLQYEIKKLTEEIYKNRENFKTADFKNAEANASITKLKEEKAYFIHVFKKIADTISHCTDSVQFGNVLSKFTQFIRKNMKQFQQTPLDRQCSFDYKFQFQKLSNFKHRLNELQEKYLKVKDQLDNQKSQKKRIVMEYNDKISKLKNQCDSLKFRVEEKQRENEVEIGHLRKIINQKNEIIYELNMKVEEQKFRKDSFASKKSRVKKRSFYIGDGDRDPNEFKMSELENEIEQLERKLVKELQQ